MSRLILLTILNLSLPFLMHWGWVLLHKKRYKNQPEIIDVTPEFPVFKLLSIGLFLLAISLLLLRFWEFEPDTWQPANPAISKDY